jgi:hypothetical protein
MRTSYLVPSLVAVLAAMICVWISPAARADDLTITVAPVSGLAGSTIIVGGNVTNTSNETDYLSADELTNLSSVVDGADSTADVAFNAFLNDTTVQIAAGQTIPFVDLFTITILASAPPGSDSGDTYVWLGGSDPSCALGGCTQQLGLASFHVDVLTPATIPEPGTLGLMAVGLLALGLGAFCQKLLAKRDLLKVRL